VFGPEDSPLEEPDLFFIPGSLFRPGSASHLVLALDVVSGH
jgi:hypothetical protein